LDVNFLKLNGNKSKVLLIGSKSSLSKAPPSISIDDCPIQISSQVKCLGTILDSTLSFIPQINNISHTAFFHFRNIARLHPSLSQHNTQILIYALVTSHLNYCNAILSGFPNKLLRLQITQNSATKIITRTKSSDHINPSLIQLHWLPVQQWINYKLLLLTFKTLHNLAPLYLSELLHPYTLSHSLRSLQLSIPTFRLSTTELSAALHPDSGNH
ncbi:hypothetical protein LDENG_00040330, partial [Lucifuga dentata]